MTIATFAMPSSLTATLTLSKDAARSKSMIPKSTIKRLWRSSNESETSYPKTRRLSKRASSKRNDSNRRAKWTVTDEVKESSQDYDPFNSENPLGYPATSLENLHTVCYSPVSFDSSHGIEHTSLSNTASEPLFLGEDFAALLKVTDIRNKESMWIDLWIPIKAGEDVIPLDGQYLSSLKSFVGLRYLKIGGMLKSYQKEIFQAVWKMEHLEELDLRVAEEPQLSPGVYWRRIEKGWLPRRREPQTYRCPGDGKGRIKKRFGIAEYLDNSVIELAKPKYNDNTIEYETWATQTLSIINLTLRGFVVDAIPFHSCFNASKLREITFTDCYDAGFYLPSDMVDTVQIKIGGFETATVAPIHNLPKELKHITLKDGKKVDEHPAHVDDCRHADLLSPEEITVSPSRIEPLYSPGRNPNRHAVIGGRSTSIAPSGRPFLFSWRRRRHDINHAIEEEDED